MYRKHNASKGMKRLEFDSKPNTAHNKTM